tara:strand:- start:179 stop:859 length:681 start_codon:yes stop_codon:yes gene_type:complete
MSKSYVIVCNRPWFDNKISFLESVTKSKFHLIKDKDQLTFERLVEISPKIIFFPFWSFIIPEKLHKQFKCIIFHMTDVPFGRGGSPLQNLIIRGYTDTIISAIKCMKEVDSGPVYLKKPLNINGNAEEIYIRASDIMQNMIVDIILEELEPAEQKGSIVNFKRRKPDEGSWAKANTLGEIYNYVRMLDASGYPPSFIKVGKFKLEFSRISKKMDALYSDVKITVED